MKILTHLSFSLYLIAANISTVSAQCVNASSANAGPDKTSLCPGNCLVIGTSSCKNGTMCSSATYSWAPGGMTTCTPTVCPTVTTNYTLYITYTCGSACCLDGCNGQCVPAAPCQGTIIEQDVMKVTVTTAGCRLLNPESTPLIENTDIKVFPNPTSSNISVQFTTINVGTCILLYDVNGKLVKEESNIKENNLKVDFDISSFAKGIYFIKVVEGTNTAYFNKLVLQ